MFAAKKKKKKPTAAKAGADDSAGAPAAAAAPSTAAPPVVAEPSPAEAAAAAAAAASAAATSAAAAAAAALSAGLAEGELEESYEEMLSRVFALLHENNPDLIGRERRKLKPPQVSRVGTTRTAWTNFREVCAGMKRTTENVTVFFLAELGTTGSIDGSERLVLKGKYQPKYIESLLRKYITEYVLCQMCRSLETDLTRDQQSRLYFMSCKACGSSRSVAPIKAGYHATAKGERRKAREALA